MQNWKKSPAREHQVDVLLFEGFSNLCLANAIEPLRAANNLAHRDLYAWRYLTPNGEQVTSSSGLNIAPHDRLSRTSGDLLLVMPSWNYRQHTAASASLRAASKRYPTLAGLDTGAWLLAEAGLLHGHRATIHWDEMTAFTERFPDITVERARQVIDGNRITGAGAMATFELILHLIGRDHGQALALEVSQFLMASAPGRARADGFTSSNRLVSRAVALMRDNIETPLPIPVIARRIGCGQRKLESGIRAEFGTTPRNAYRRLRLNLARKLVTETGLAIPEIALRCGYENASAMTRAYRAEFGTTPRDTRK